MSTESRYKYAKMASDEHIAEEDRKQRDKDSKRALVGNIVGAGLKAAGSVVGGALKGAKAGAKLAKTGAVWLSSRNHPSWYQKFIDKPDTVSRIPTFLNVSSVSKGVSTFMLNNGSFIGATAPSAAISESDIQGSGCTTPLVVTHHFMPYIGTYDRFYCGDTSYNGAGARDVHPANATLLMDITNLGKVNSRAINPDPSIPGLYIVGAVDIYAFLAEYKFLIDVFTYFSPTNSQIPKAIIEGKGWDYADFCEYIADHRKNYRVLRAYANANLPLPSDISLLQRRVWLNSVLIKDTSSVKSCYLQFKQIAYCTVNPAGNNTETTYWFSGINPVSTPRERGIQGIQSWFRLACDKLILDGDYATFIANMRSAYSVDRFYVAPDLDEMADHIIESDPMIKLQMQNILTLPQPVYQQFGSNSYDRSIITSYQVTTDSEGFLQMPRSFGISITATAADWPSIASFMSLMETQTLFNSHDDNVTDDDMFVMTRLHPVFRVERSQNPDDSTKNVWLVRVGACGTEIIVGSMLTLYNLNTQTFTNLRVWSGVTNETSANYINSSIFSAIDCMYPIYVGKVQGSDYYCTPVNNLDNFFYIPNLNVAELHNVSVRSEFYMDPSAQSKTLIR